ncbi:MAG TPA: LysE family transporter [Bacteroidia bacterium]|nr:LysE family transporter [Bacteroidia bacterium]HNP98491.1 LysE family transporter [Bacteroidia bacterium]
MATLAIVFFASALLSFIGSMHIGLVNLAVIRSALQEGFRPALKISIGGVLPEILYSFLACLLFRQIHSDSILLLTLNWLSIPFFLILGIYQLRIESSLQVDQKNQVRGKISTGVYFGMMNPQLLPFWFGVLVYMNSYFTISSITQQLAFSIGSAVGAFILLYLLAKLVIHRKSEIRNLFSKYQVDRFIGWTFILLALIKTCTLLSGQHFH